MRKNILMMLAVFLFAGCAWPKFYYEGDLPLDQSLLQEKFAGDKRFCVDRATEFAKVYGGFPDYRWFRNALIFPIPCASCNSEKFEKEFNSCMETRDWKQENPQIHRRHLLFKG